VIDHRIDQAIIWLTLLGLVFAALSFAAFEIVAIFNEPKVVFLHLIAGLIAVIWSWQAAFRSLAGSGEVRETQPWDLVVWVGSNPARWALIAVAVWIFAQIASTILSPLPIISFFGGDEARSGYNLYDSLSLFVILLAVAFKFRSHRSMELLVYTLVATGTLAAAYGIGQHFGWDPLGGNIGRTRVISSFGNTLNFGAYMVMSIPATAALIYMRRNNWLLWSSGITLALALQMTGLWFAGGRGPFISAFASIAVFLVLSIAMLNTRQVLYAVGSIVIASIITAAIVALPSDQGDIGLARIQSIGSQLNTTSSSTNIEGGLSGRLNIWESSLKIATGWDLPIEEPIANRMLRPVFGLGQDMYVYSFPLVGKPQSGLAVVDHTHNYTLQILFEQGFLGLLGFLTMSGLLTVAVIFLVIKLRKVGREPSPTTVLVLALSPAIIGKMIEMQSGVARVSDLAMNMALFGAVVALFEVAIRVLDSENTTTPTRSTPKRSAYEFQAHSQAILGANLILATVLTVTVISIFISWDMRRITASRDLAIGYDNPSLQERALLWDDIQRRAPERESFTFSLFEEYYRSAQIQFDLGNEEEALRQMHYGRNMLLVYEQRDPLELDTQNGLLKAASTLISWGHTEYAQELADRAIKLADTNPAYPSILGTSATALTSVGLHELAIEYADQAIATEATTQPWAKAWYAKGRALIELDRDDEAIAVLTTATEKQPGAEGALLSHQLLAQLYLERGDNEAFELHKELGGGEITVIE
tara:strand:- start:202 stop:2481 length:2280 start_codon:yes stop_codon:yes gene_type:complete